MNSSKDDLYLYMYFLTEYKIVELWKLVPIGLMFRMRNKLLCNPLEILFEIQIP